MLPNRTPRPRRARRRIDEELRQALNAARRHPGVGHAFEHLLVQVREHSALLRALPTGGCSGAAQACCFAGGLLALAHHYADWRRDPALWRPVDAAALTQFGSLAGHLLAKETVPRFMVGVWLQPRSAQTLREQKWYKHLGAGCSIRGTDVPLRLTKPAARQFAHAPDHYTVYQALRRAQVLGLGGDESLARAVAESRLGQSFGDERYWEGVIQLLSRHRPIDAGNVALLVEFLSAHAGEFVSLRQNADQFMRRVRRWRAVASPVIPRPKFRWRRSGIEPMDYVETRRGGSARRSWFVRELVDSSELIVEGKALHHCVATYASRCARGLTTIWSLSCSDERSQWRRELTIEVNPATRTIVQARGSRDSLPSAPARAVLFRWARLAGLTFARRL